jgi:hypothetical protein
VSAVLCELRPAKTCQQCRDPILPRRRGDGRWEVPSHFAKRKFCGYSECAKVTAQLALVTSIKTCTSCGKQVKRRQDEDRNKFLKRTRCTTCSGARTGLTARIEQWFIDNPGEYMTAEDFAVKFDAKLRYVRNCLSAMSVAGVIKRESVWRSSRDDEQS